MLAGWRYLAFGTGIGITAVFLSPTTFQRVEGESMQPTLNPKYASKSWLKNDIVIVRKINSKKDLSILKGKIVCAAISPDRRIIKRLTATSGDIVQPAQHSSTLQLPQDTCWLQSDGGHGYLDSNILGPIPNSSIYAEVLFVTWPPTRFAAKLTK